MNERLEIEHHLSKIQLQQLEDNYIRKKSRNQEVDQLLNNIHDPRVLERLQIYRLVQEKFLEVENQVRQEVKDEISKKKQRSVTDQPALTGPPHAKALGKILKSSEKIHKKPAPFKANSARFYKVEMPSRSKKTSQPQLSIKYNPSTSMNTFMELSDDSESSSTFQKNAFVSSSQASQNSHRKNENVGLVNYIYQDADFRHRKWLKLTSHLLQGINIDPSPNRPLNHLVRSLLDSKEHRIFVEKSHQDPETRHILENRHSKSCSVSFPSSPKENDTKEYLPSEKGLFPTKSGSRTPQVEFRSKQCLSLSPVSIQSCHPSENLASQDSNSSPDYSMTFEAEEHFDQQGIEHFASSAGSTNDRLSTIPENSKSQVDDSASSIQSPERKIYPPSITDSSLQTVSDSEELDNLMYTKSAKAMLELLDELSLNQNLSEENSKKDESRHSSSRQASEMRQKTRLKQFRPPNQNPNSSSGSSIPLYSASTSFTSEPTSLDVEISEGPLNT